MLGDERRPPVRIPQPLDENQHRFPSAVSPVAEKRPVNSMSKLAWFQFRGITGIHHERPSNTFTIFVLRGTERLYLFETKA